MIETVPVHDRDYRRIETAIGLMQAGYSDGVDSRRIAAKLGLSEFHFRRLFREWAGIPPERFIRYLSKEHALQLIRESRSYLEASLAAGFSGPGRLAEASVVFDAMSPQEIRSGGEGLAVRIGSGITPFGEALIAESDRGIVDLRFTDGEQGPLEQEIRAGLPRARFIRDDRRAAELLTRAFAARRKGEMKLLVRGTNFQVKVWEALLRLPPGGVADYAELARAAGSPGAARAAGSALAANRIAWLIPCHRVIRAAGESGEYRWGIFRKRAMIGWEAVRFR